MKQQHPTHPELAPTGLAPTGLAPTALTRITLASSALLALGASGTADDCNGNGIDDALDIQSGSSLDCNLNAIPDECDLDGILTLDLDFDGSSLPPGASLTMSGLWHTGAACRPAGSCGEQNFAYFGLDASCDFDSGNLFGDFGTLAVRGLELPHTPELELSFCSCYEGEGGTTGALNDLAIVYIEESGVGGSSTLLEFTSGTSSQASWERRALDISAWRGLTVDIEFFFNSGDELFNNYFGWGLDELRVTRPADLNSNGLLDDCECFATRYCAAGPNSVGAGARVGFEGTLMIARNDFRLLADALPANQFGIFYFGLAPAQLVFGNGFRCIAAPFLRLPIVSTTSGHASFDYDYTDWNQNPGNHVHAGASASFQFWYRDPAGGGASFNLSDGLRATFCP